MERQNNEVLNNKLIFKAELLKMLNKGMLNQSQYEAILRRYELTYKKPDIKQEIKEQNVDHEQNQKQLYDQYQKHNNEKNQNPIQEQNHDHEYKHNDQYPHNQELIQEHNQNTDSIQKYDHEQNQSNESIQKHEHTQNQICESHHTNKQAKEQNEQHIIKTDTRNSEQRITKSGTNDSSQHIITSEMKQPQNPNDLYQTMILTIGVVLVLLAGIVFATTTWNVYDNFTKLIFLSSGSIIFFLASIIAEKKLKIAKTGLAFWSLGSMYIPILFLGIGFFGLFGDYLSLEGEGRYLLGAIATGVATPIYFYSSIKYKDRIFSYVTLTCVSLLFAFIGLQLYENILFMLLSLSVVNGIHLAAGKKIYRYESIVKSLNPYILTNTIILSAMVPLVTSFVEKNVFGILFYLAMIFTYVYTHFRQKPPILFSIFSGIMVIITGVYVTHSVFRVLNYDILDTHYYVSLFGTFILIYFGFYYLNRLEPLKNLKYPCLITTSIAVTVLYVFNLVEMNATYNTIYLLINLALTLLVYLRERDQDNGFKTVYGISMYVLFVGATIQSYFAVKTHINLSLFEYFSIGYIILFLLIVLLRRLKQDIALIHIRIVLVSLIPLLLVATSWVHDHETIVGIPYILMNHIVLLTCLTLYKKLFNPLQYERGMILIGNFVNITFTVYYLIKLTDYSTDFTLLIATLIILVVSYVLKKEWRPVTNHYLLGSLFITLIYNTYRFEFNVSKSYQSFDYMIETYYDQAIIRNFIPLVIALVILIRLIHKLRYTFLLPLALSIATWVMYSVSGLLTSQSDFAFQPIQYDGAAAWAQSVFALILFILGNILFRKLYHVERHSKENSESEFTIKYDSIQIDFYSILALVNLVLAYSLADGDFITLLIIDLLISSLILYQLLRTSHQMVHKVIVTIVSYMLLVPYRRIIGEFMDIDHVLFAELIIVPLIVVTALICQGVYKNYLKESRYVDGVIALIGMGMLLSDVFHKSELTNSIIFFVLTLTLIVYGYAKQYIAYFMIGFGYLFIFILYETRNFWTNIPWWAYLLLAGLILIFISSLNEIEKRYEFSLKEKVKSLFKKLNE